MLYYRRCNQKIAEVQFSGLGIECEFLKDSAAILASIDSVKIANPVNDNMILIAEKVSFFVLFF